MLPPSSETSKDTDTVDNTSVSEGVPNNPETQVEEPSPGMGKRIIIYTLPHCHHCQDLKGTLNFLA